MRYWAQTGVVGPSQRAGGRTVYSFQDLVGVKAAKELLDGGLTLQRARKNLEALRAQLGRSDASARPLAGVRIRSDGDRASSATKARAFEPLTGQLVLDFAVDELQRASCRRRSVPTTKRADVGAGPGSSKAATAKRAATTTARSSPTTRRSTAIRRSPPRTPTSATCSIAAASAARRAPPTRWRWRSIPSSPRRATTSATCSTTSARRSAARVEWFRVAGACPEFADAHYNLALAAARDGDGEAARTHLERYLLLVPDEHQAPATLLARL